MIYFAFIQQHKGYYNATFPDMPGCATGGDSLEELMINAKDALELHIEGMLEDGDELPAPRFVGKRKDLKEYREGAWIAVEVDVTEIAKRSKGAERVNVTIPKKMLSKIDSYRYLLKESRSGFLTMAAMDYIRRNQT